MGEPGGKSCQMLGKGNVVRESSLISTNSRAWFFKTSLAGIGTILLAILKGGERALGLAFGVLGATMSAVGNVGVDVTTVDGLNNDPAFATDAGMSGMDCKESGSNRVVADVAN